MTERPDPWGSIRAAWDRDGDGAALAEARKAGIRAIEVIGRIGAWKAEIPPEPETEPVEKPGTMPAISSGEAHPEDDRLESDDDVVRAHRSVLAQYRAVLEGSLDSVATFAGYVSSFVDVGALEEFRIECIEKGDLTPFTKRMESIARSIRDSVENASKLGRPLKDVIEAERQAWDIGTGKDEEEGTYDWEAILEDLRTPLEPLSLPNNVIEFEKKINKRSAS